MGGRGGERESRGWGSGGPGGMSCCLHQVGTWKEREKVRFGGYVGGSLVSEMPQQQFPNHSLSSAWVAPPEG